MSKGINRSKANALRKEKAAKKTKQKKMLILCICSLMILAVAGIALYSALMNKNTEIYGYYGQTVQLLENGNFSAMLAHNVRKNGTYTKRIEDDRITVIFNVNGNIELGWIINNVLHIPTEWDDGHGHGSVFPKVN